MPSDLNDIFKMIIRLGIVLTLFFCFVLFCFVFCFLFFFAFGVFSMFICQEGATQKKRQYEFIGYRL